MNSTPPIHHHCAFQIHCVPAQQVKLVLEHRMKASPIFTMRPHGEGIWDVLIEPGSNTSQIVSLRPYDDGIWKTALDLDPGEYRYCFHAYDGRSLTYLLPADAPLDGLKAVMHVGYNAPATNTTSNQERTAHEPRSYRWNRSFGPWSDPLLCRTQRL